MTTTTTSSRDITRITLSVLSVVGLLASSFLILAPFLPSLVWGTTIVVTTWPALLRVQGWMGGRRGPAVAVMAIVLLVVVVIPLYLATSSIASRADGLAELARSVSERTFPPPPEWLAEIPLVGSRLQAAWLKLAAGGLAGQGVNLAPYATRAIRFLLGQARSFGLTILQFLITVGVAAVLYSMGERSGMFMRRFFRRLAGQRGEGAVVLAGKAVRAVALGVMVTALVQTVLSGVGLLIAGVPYAGVLTAVCLILCIAQVGPALVLIPTIIWVFSSGRTGAGTFLLIYSLAPLTIDNFMRPYLIKRGANLPLWLIFMGVVGGLVTFGVIGLFIGPVILAVTYTLVLDWVNDLGPEAAATPSADRPVAGLGEAP